MTVANPITWKGESPPPATDINQISGMGTFGRSLATTETLSDARTLLGVNVDPFGLTTITVGTNGDYSTIGAAITAITDASDSKRYSVLLISNTTETTGITWKDYILLDLNGFKATITDATSAAGITVSSSITNALFLNGEIIRSTASLIDTVALKISSISGNAVRFVNLRVQNNINLAGCYAISCEGGCDATFRGLSAIAQSGATASVNIKGTSQPTFQECQLRGAIVRNAALPTFLSCANSGNGGYALSTNDGSSTKINGGNWSLNGANLGVQTNNNSSLYASNVFLHNTPTIRSSTSVTATTSVVQAGQVVSVGINVTVAGSAGALLRIGTTAAGNDILPDTLVDTTGVKSVTLATQPNGSGTIYITVTGTGLSATLDIASGDNTANCYAVTLNGTGEVVFDDCSIMANANSHAVYISAAAATANKARFSNTVVRCLRNTSNTTSTAFYAVSSWVDAWIKNCTLDAPVQYTNVTPVIDATVAASARRKATLFPTQLTATGGGGCITSDDQILVWGKSENNTLSQVVGDSGMPAVLKCNGTRTGTWTKLVLNRFNVFAVTSTGELWGMGDNTAGQLGLGDTTNTGTRYRLLHKITITGKLVADVLMAAGDTTNMSVYAVCTDGTLASWGYNASGQLGVNNTTNYSSPQLMALPAGSSNVQAISAANAPNTHVLVRTSDNKLHTCGNNSQGQLGQGDTVNRLQLTTVSGKLVVAVQANGGGTTSGTTFYGHSQIILTSGSLQSAGYNGQGQLGNNSTTNSNVFVNTSLNHTNVSAIIKNATIYDNAGYIAAGIAWLVGGNTNGHLGNGGTTQSNIYIQPSGAFQGYVTKGILAGYSAVAATAVTCVLLATTGANNTGEVWTTGANAYGQCGDGTVTNRTTFARVAMPEAITDIFSSGGDMVTSIAIFALGASGRIYAMGRGSYGATGLGHLLDSYVPNEVLMR